MSRLNLSAEDMEAYRKKFNAFDLNKDGVISMREFAAVSKVFGYKLSKIELMVSASFLVVRVIRFCCPFNERSVNDVTRYICINVTNILTHRKSSTATTWT